MLLFFSLFLRKDGRFGEEHRGNRGDYPKNHEKIVPDKIKNVDRRSKCVEGYKNDGSFDKKGCWRCENSCANDESCEYPGICRSVVPRISGVSLRKHFFTSNSDRIVVFYEHKAIHKDNVPKKAFCKFNGNSSLAVKISYHAIVCEIPPYPFKDVSVSFDGQNWSLSESASNTGLDLHFIMHVIGFALCIVCFIVIVRHFRSSRNYNGMKSQKDKPIAIFPAITNNDPTT